MVSDEVPQTVSLSMLEANHGILHFFVQATRLKVWYSNKIMQHSHSNSFVLNIQ